MRVDAHPRKAEGLTKMPWVYGGFAADAACAPANKQGRGASRENFSGVPGGAGPPCVVAVMLRRSMPPDGA